MMGVHERRFPAENPQYRQARDRLLKAEIELREQIERVARERRSLPPGGAVKEDYRFEALADDGSVESVRLSELFAPGKPSLVVYSYMYGPKMKSPCPLCTSIIDGLNASAPHVTQRVNLVVVAKSPIERIMEFAGTRNWDKIRLLSSQRNSYNSDYWAEDPEEKQWPMLNVFTRRQDGIYHFWGAELLYAGGEGQPRHVDLLWPLWNIFDLTPDGRGSDWYPKLSYD
jgi:predicted dithiol-disulfide oxidoreductase (DUF899 family)